MLSASGFGEEGVEGVVGLTHGRVGRHGPVGTDPVLQAISIQEENVIFIGTILDKMFLLK